jgi:hypothetical protein
MLRWLRLPAARASRWKRTVKSALPQYSRFRIFTATERFSSVSSAAYTDPMPPRPISPISR